MKYQSFHAACLVAAGLALTPSLAGAVEAQPGGKATLVKPLADTLSGDAKLAYESAKLLFADRDFAGALAKFKRAHELSKEPRLLWNMAVCEKEQRHYSASSMLVERYLAEGAKVITPESKASATETLRTLQGFSSVVTIAGAPAGAKVFVDEQEVATLPLTTPLHLDLGVRKVRIEARGYEVFEQKFEIPGTTAVAIEAKLRLDATASRLTISSGESVDSIHVDGKHVGDGRWEGSLAPGQHTVLVTSPGKKRYETQVDLAAKSTRTVHVALENDFRAQWQPRAGWAALGLGAAGVAVGGITGAMAVGKRNELDCPNNVCPEGTDPGQVSGYDGLRVASSVGFIAGGILAATGVTLLWIVPAKSDDGASISAFTNFTDIGVRGAF